LVLLVPQILEVGVAVLQDRILHQVLQPAEWVVAV
jgi:hypothetical protein